ncbi:MAG: ABC transporter ATP-binding protein [Halanaerobium sp.]
MLKIENLSFAYKHDLVLKEIDFQAENGELITLLGANGSGKTTFLKCIQGLLSLDAGEILIDGENIIQMGKKDRAQKIAVVPQEHKNIFAHKVIDMVVMGINPWLSFGDEPRKEHYLKAEEILAELNIYSLKDKNFNRISGGERQLVLIARALMQKSYILLLDEPNSHLDFKNMHHIMDIMHQLKFNNKIIITALHDPNLAYRYSDKIIIFKQGRILAAGAAEKVMTEENLSKAYNMKINTKKTANLNFFPASQLKKDA